MTCPRTPEMKAVLDFITDYCAEHGYSPTIREISKKVGVTVSGAHRNVAELAADGHVLHSRGKRRGVSIIDPAQDRLELMTRRLIDGWEGGETPRMMLAKAFVEEVRAMLVEPT